MSHIKFIYVFYSAFAAYCSYQFGRIKEHDEMEWKIREIEKERDALFRKYVHKLQ